MFGRKRRRRLDQERSRRAQEFVDSLTDALVKVQATNATLEAVTTKPIQEGS